jgi:ketosteroid isomerase-like protein
MKMFLSTVLCVTAMACGGSAPQDSAVAARQSDALEQGEGEHHRSGRAALFAADALHTRLIERLGPVEGLLRPMRGNALYLAAGIDVVRGKRNIAAALEAENPNPAQTSLKRTLAGGDVSADGNFGFTFGWVERNAPAAGGTTTTTYGTYVSAWTREDDDEPFRVDAYYARVSLTPHLPTRDGFPLLLGGAGAGGVPRRGDLERQKRSLLRADADFAALSVAQGFSIAFPAYAADFVMPFGRNFFFVVGKQEVIDFWAGWTPAEVLSWTPLFAGSSESGDLGYTVGTSIDAITNPDGTIDRFHGKYLTIWARRADGAWRFIADGGSPSPAPSP